MASGLSGQSAAQLQRGRPMRLFGKEGTPFRNTALSLPVPGAGFEGEGRITQAQTKNGKMLEASLVVVGVGARPNTGLFKGQLDILDKAPGGIKVGQGAVHPLVAQGRHIKGPAWRLLPPCRLARVSAPRVFAGHARLASRESIRVPCPCTRDLPLFCAPLCKAMLALHSF